MSTVESQTGMESEKPVRVIIADDQPVVRSGLSTFLRSYSDVLLVGEAEDGEEAVQLVELTQPDLVLMDVEMPHMDGIAATRLIRARWPQIQVLMLTGLKEHDRIQAALQAGAQGFCFKDINADELHNAILKVRHGQREWTPAAARALEQAEHLHILAAELQRSGIEPGDLPALLQEHLPAVFPECHLIVRIFPNREYLWHPSGHASTVPDQAWAWLQLATQPQTFAPGDQYPWGGQHNEESGLILAPIPGPDHRPIGGVSIVQFSDPLDLANLLPVVRSLCEGISTVVSRSLMAQTPARSDNQELVSAGQIQANILPDEAPSIPGWDLSARLESARETSGDFFDFIRLPNGQWGLVIADVTDKGMGAALFMALSSTLIRTYAIQYPTLPAFALGAVNRRILSDTRGSMFVTAFYAVLDPNTGRIRYVNAGHNPPYLVSGNRGKPVDRLRGTGMALGVDEEAIWQQKVIRMVPGDVLLMYTDGVTEAQNPQGEYFGEQRMLDIVRARMGCPAREIQDAVLTAVREFTGGVGSSDDITLMVVARKS